MIPTDKKNSSEFTKSGACIADIVALNTSVSYSALSIPRFVQSYMKGLIQGDYRTARGIDLHSFEPAVHYCTHSEIERVAGARSLKRQVEWLCGRIALKELIRSVLLPEADFRDIVIDYDISGRPSISGHLETGITVSHSGDFAMAAIHKLPGARIGLDIERTSGIDISPVLSVAFSKDEQQVYSSLPAEKIIEAFTVKEAYLKLTGQGFHETVARVTYIDGKVLFDGTEVQGIERSTFIYGNEYIVSIIYDIYNKK